MKQSSKYFKACIVMFLIFLYAPAFLLPIFSFNDSKVIAFPLSGFSTVWFEQLLYEDTLHDALRNSLFIAVSSSILATVFGTLVARASSRYQFFGQRASVTFILVPLILPVPVMFLGLFTSAIQALIFATLAAYYIGEAVEEHH